MAAGPQPIMGSNLNVEQIAGMSAHDINERRLVKHAPVAQALRAGPSAVTAEIIAKAHVQVELWEKNFLCSQDYIADWKYLLRHPERAADVLEERSPRAAALRQNTPFVAAVREYQFLARAA